MLKSMRIREYRPEDFDRLYRIDRICFEAGISYSRTELMFYLHCRGSATRIAEVSGEIGGFAIGRVDQRRAHVITLDVVPEARRCGVGTALMNSLHDEFVRCKADFAVLEVSADNAVARRFYERLHYRYAGVLPGYYGGRVDAFRMVCRLKRELDDAVSRT